MAQGAMERLGRGALAETEVGSASRLSRADVPSEYCRVSQRRRGPLNQEETWGSPLRRAESGGEARAEEHLIHAAEGSG